MSFQLPPWAKGLGFQVEPDFIDQRVERGAEGGDVAALTGAMAAAITAIAANAQGWRDAEEGE